jgi:hypothetical protein
MLDDYGYRPIGETLATILEAVASGVYGVGPLVLKTRQEPHNVRVKMHRLHNYHLVRQVKGKWEITAEGRKALAAHKAAKAVWESTK